MLSIVLAIACIFAIAVVAVYVIQPDYAKSFELDAWKSLSDYASIFPAK